MRKLAAAIVIVPLMLIGAMPVAAGQPSSTGTQAQSAPGSNSADDRGTYRQKTQAEMQEWQQKLHDFSETAKAKGQKAGTAAENGLKAAWAKTQAAAHKLQTVGAKGWDSAKSSYEKASHDLADAWDKIRPKGK